MKMTNNMQLLIASEGKLFLVTHVCQSVEYANQVMKDIPETACISEDEKGNIYLAKTEPLLDLNKLTVIPN